MSSELTAVLAALSDPTRRAAVQRLAQGPATASQLAALAPISRPAVSQHLRVLREVGLVRMTPSGRNVWYELAGVPLLDAHRWLDGLVEQWVAGPTRLERTTSPPTKEPR